MAVGQIISASRYNIMQARILSILGNGSGEFGYGQTVSSISLAPTVTVDATHMSSIKTDLINAYVHQNGSLPVLTTVNSADEITDSVYAEYESVSLNVFNNKNIIFVSTQASVEVKINSQRITQWGGSSQPQSIFHEFRVIFNNEDHRRHFFNAGGEIRINSTLTGGTGGLKNLEWLGMLSAMGTIRFNYTATTAVSGITTNIGNFDLTNSYQIIYNKPGTGVYSDNNYIVKARENSSSQITFLIEYYDGLTTNLDESVTGTITSSISQLRPTGPYVEVPTPSYQNIQTL